MPVLVGLIVLLAACTTGIDIQHEGTAEFEAQLNVRVSGGNAPDLAIFPQPGLLAQFARAGKLKRPSAAVKQNATRYFSPDWVAYGSVGGTFYAAPADASVKSFVSTSWQEGGLPILKDKCALHRAASFYAAQWPTGTKVGPNGDVYAFYLPPIDPALGKPVLGAGGFVGAFSDRPEVRAVQEYLSTAEWVNSRASRGDGGWISASKGLDVSNLKSPVDRLSYRILQDPKAVFRFDGSDLMPGSVGAGSFWKAMVAWLNGRASKAALTPVEQNWPK